MSKIGKFFLAILPLYLLCPTYSVSQTSGMFVTGYYPVWSLGTTNGGNANAMYPHEANWNGVTHVVHFGVGPDQTPPYWRPAQTNNFGGASNDSINMFYAYDWRGNRNYSMVDSLRKYVHAAGGKLLLSCGGIWGAQASAMNYITSDSGRTQVFVNAVVGFAARHGYDGIEIDYEPPQSQAAMSLLTRIMRRGMTQFFGADAPLVITVANLAEANYSLALRDSVTQYLFMMYDMHNPYNGIGSAGSIYDVTGYNSPLHRPDTTLYPMLNFASLNYDGRRPADPTRLWGPNKFAALGFPRAKIGVGIPFYGYAFDTRQAPNQPSVGIYAHYLNYVDAQTFLTRGGTYNWDNSAKVPWAGGVATANVGWVITSGHQTFVTYDDTNSVREKVRWAKDNGFGGMMIYELWTGWVASAPSGRKDPLLRTLVNEVNNPPVLLPTGSFGATPNLLPSGGGSVVLNWTSTNAMTASIDQGIGSVPVSGSRTITVDSTKTFRLTLVNGNGSQIYTVQVVVALPLPSGTFVVTPDSLPVGGGTVQLTWSSTGADSATITPNIGVVPLSGTRSAVVGSTTTFVLTLKNQGGQRQYAHRVGVGLPGGQQGTDITAQATPVALITLPTGAGNHSIEIMRDGNLPPVGSTNVLDQYDTYDGVATRTFEWIGYQFSNSRTFTHLLYQEGLDNQFGGCFETLRVQVLNGGQWQDVQGLVSDPPYPGSNLVNFESFDLQFTPVSGRGIRLAGPPTGSDNYIGVAELRVFDDGATSIPPETAIPREYLLQQNYPNPFNPSTSITFGLPVSGDASLKVYDALGREVASLVNGFMEAGKHSVAFVGTGLADGVYFYTLRSGDFLEMRKMILLK